MSPFIRKPAFCICKNIGADQMHGKSAFVFATYTVQSLFSVNQNFQASSHPLWMYSPVCVRLGQIFFGRGSYLFSLNYFQSSIKSRQEYLCEQMPTTNYFFLRNIEYYLKIIILIPTPGFPRFDYILGAHLG